MKKIVVLLTFILIFLQSDSFATSEPASETAGEFETRWGLGIGVGYKPVKELFTDPRLCINLETTRKGESMPMWRVQITLGDRDPQGFFPMSLIDGKPYVLCGIVGGAAGVMGAVIAAKYFEKTITRQLAVRAGMVGAGVGVMGVFLAADVVPFTLRMIDKMMRSNKVRDSLISLTYHIKSTDDAAETRIFRERTGEDLNNSSRYTNIRRSPLDDGDRRADGSFDLFSYVLADPIVHIADLNGRLRSLLTRLEGGVSIPLKFKVNGLSKNPSEYVRNWNSFAVLASFRCMGVPFGVDPRLEEYIDDVKLRERWGDSKTPTYDNVLEIILAAYKKIQGGAPGFTMNRDYVAFFGEKLNGYIYNSGITNQLRLLDEGAGGGTAAAGGGGGTAAAGE